MAASNERSYGIGYGPVNAGGTTPISSRRPCTFTTTRGQGIPWDLGSKFYAFKYESHSLICGPEYMSAWAQNCNKELHVYPTSRVVRQPRMVGGCTYSISADSLASYSCISTSSDYPAHSTPFVTCVHRSRCDHRRQSFRRGQTSVNSVSEPAPVAHHQTLAPRSPFLPTSLSHSPVSSSLTLTLEPSLSRPPSHSAISYSPLPYLPHSSPITRSSPTFLLSSSLAFLSSSLTLLPDAAENVLMHAVMTDIFEDASSWGVNGGCLVSFIS